MPALLYACLLWLLAPSLLAASLDGHYRATLDGQPAELILHSQGSAITGQYLENHSLRLDLHGSFDGQLLRVEIREPQSGLIIANMNASYANDMLNARIAARDPRNGAVLEREAVFQKQQEPPPVVQPPASNGQLDPALIGTWVHEKMIASGGANPASFTTQLTLHLGADGGVAQWRRALGGGAEWSYDSPGELQYRGRWHSANGLLMVQLQGSDAFQPAAHYRFSPPYLVTESNTGKMIWQRR
ncbi:hypothetical protein HP532_23050 [Pseudomonas sp. CrR25]|nr:hypothetical protein [Pseudomonas sp. CrR25]